jgi:hypothetical protein
MSLYGDALRAIRQVILLDERVRTLAADTERMSREVRDLRDRISRIEGMLAASLGSAGRTRRLPGPRSSDESG